MSENTNTNFISHLHLKRIVLGTFMANLVLGFGYLITLNGLATQGFDLETLKAQRIDLQKQMERSDIALAIPSSIYALERNELIQDMEIVGGKVYLEIRNNEVALR